MVQKVRKSKKKVASKPNTSANAAKPAASEQQPPKSPMQDAQNEQNWTPMQLEQIELSKKLDNYISGFQKKLLRLNFQPSNRELVILFIMNLHPRWRRMVEPVELSCSSWVEAAAFARLHCARVSAILGCENRADAIFKTSEVRALRDSGYFAPDDADLKHHTPESIAHLLNPEEDNDSEKSDAENKLGSSSPPVPTVYMNNTMSVSPVINATSASTAPPVKSASVEAPTDQIRNVSSPKKVVDEKEGKSAGREKEKVSPSALPSVSQSSTSESSQTLKPDVKDLTPASTAASTAATASSSSSSPPPTKAQMQAKVQQAIKNRKEKEKEKEKKAQTQMQQQMKQLEKMSTITPDQMGTVLTNIPKQHLGINLTFLELPVNGKKVKGLLAKLSWGSSAISVDCAQRLGLKMKPSDHLCINTDFGYVDSVGILTLPIHHPADPTGTKSEMNIQVLPMIYGGKVDLVLGADFFCFYNPTLNIRTRAICFLEKETPYIVEKLVE
ncbi:Transcription factor spt20 [Mucor velutinosus]|uniref:Transcription factor spt20 n=1 Tax=Mucor velutinosus TaxID=708070 RepID=A0AAN7D8I8_9FUNG|nr:Transcription factor spt20 [Mucor velutinosus]